MRKVISVFTSTRAEYHLLYSVIKRIDEDPDLELDLIVSGTHLSHKFGYTIDQIIKDGFHISEKISTINDNSEINIDNVIADTLLGCSNHFRKIHSDFLIVLGDRYEILGAVIAAANALIPIAHIHGGETTEGAIDEAIRHAVTKFSYLHFACCEPYRNRIVQLGENPNRVYNVGALGVENIMNQKLMSKEELSNSLNVNLEEFCLVTFHPVTLESDTSKEQVLEMLNALLKFSNMKYIITKANADQGGNAINEILDDFSKKYSDRIIVVASLGMQRYLSAMKYCKLVIGNSSSGILEAPSFKVPTINIGDRQLGRIQAKSIINCEPKTIDIVNAMKKGLNEKFRLELDSMESIYGDGHASEIIVKIIKETIMNGVDLKKKFYDIEFEECS